MEANNLPGGMLPGMTSRMLGLDMPLHPHQQQQQQQHPHQQQQQQQNQHQPPQLVAFAAHSYDAHSQQPLKQSTYPYPTKPKQQQSPLSDDDEPGFTVDDGGGDEKKRLSPWQRMKWTDTMVRLLIMVVFYIGDDASSEGNDPTPTGVGKKKSGGLLQKKGKWKSVSRAMMEKGFFVSPQQCEDKFNDLNKRYKRVNDILGKGTACRVVENQNLLDTMDLPHKMKEEVKKLLNSKHLFFREMCAYHNSGGGGGGSGAHCLHSPDGGGANSRNRVETAGLKVLKGDDRAVVDVDDEDDEDDDEEEEEEETEDGVGRSGHNEQGEGHGDEDDDEKSSSKKRQRQNIVSLMSPSMKQLSCELVSLLQDGTKSPWEQKQWLINKLMQLEEQRVGYQCEAFELEKQRLQWVKFSGKKEREMERMKLNNERMRLENERMLLILRHKELELLDVNQQHSSNKRSDPSSITG